MSFAAQGQRIIEGALAGLYKAGTQVMARAEYYIPVETGTAKRSGVVEQPVLEYDRASVTVGFGYGDEVNPLTGEPAAGYVVYLHERMDTHHQAPTRAKFLELAAREMEPEFGVIVNDSIKERSR